MAYSEWTVILIRRLISLTYLPLAHFFIDGPMPIGFAIAAPLIRFLVLENTNSRSGVQFEGTMSF